MTRAQVTDVLDAMYDTLEFRVGKRLAEQMDHNQLATFERLVDANREEQALEWLGTNFPHYRDVVQDEYDHILRVLTRTARLSQARTDAAATQSAGSTTSEPSNSEREI